MDPYRKAKHRSAPQSIFSSQSSPIAKSPSFPGSDKSGEVHTAHSESLQGSARLETLFLSTKIEKDDSPDDNTLQYPAEKECQGEVIEDKRVFKLTLKETNTMRHLNLPSTVVPEGSDEAQQLKVEIDRYIWQTEGKGKIRKRVDAETQTLGMPTKRKSSMTTPIETKSVHSFVSAWDIYDTYEETDKGQKKFAKYGRTFDDESKIDFAISDVESFLNSAMILERMLASNTFTQQIAMYTGYVLETDNTEPLSKFQYKMFPLWIYNSSLTKGRAVISFSWNSTNKDILAVGYGQWLVTDEVKSGLVCCWSIKNPTNPERSFAQTHPVSCVCFSISKPHLLAVASIDGAIKLLDIGSASRKPIVIPSDGRRYHSGPVWGLQWTNNWGEYKGQQLLVSTGDDGQVLRWTLDNFFNSVDGTRLSTPLHMMYVDSAPGSFGYPVNNVPIQRFFSGLGLDLCLNARQPTLYVATKEGYIVEVEAEMQMRRSRKVHCGPVFTVQASPFCPQLILTAGAEGVVSLWTTDSEQPLLSLHISEDAVVGAVWSPSHSSILATASGRVMSLWDIVRKTHAPVSSVTLPNLLSAVTFCPAGRNLLAGDRMGSVHVYNLQDLPYPALMQLEALVRIFPDLKPFLSNENDDEEIC